MVEILKPDTPVCLNSATHSASFWVFPSDGVWSKEKHYNLLLKCQDDVVLKGAKPSSSCEGGFEWATADGDSQEIRTYEWSSWMSANWTLWPTQKDFTTPIFPRRQVWNTFRVGHTYLPVIHCRAKGNPPFAKVVRLLLLMEASGHIILGTEGFVITENRAYLKKGTHKRTTRYVIGDLITTYNASRLSEYMQRREKPHVDARYLDLNENDTKLALDVARLLEDSYVTIPSVRHPRIQWWRKAHNGKWEMISSLEGFAVIKEAINGRDFKTTYQKLSKVIQRDILLDYKASDVILGERDRF